MDVAEMISRDLTRDSLWLRNAQRRLHASSGWLAERYGGSARFYRRLIKGDAAIPRPTVAAILLDLGDRRPVSSIPVDLPGEIGSPEWMRAADAALAERGYGLAAAAARYGRDKPTWWRYQLPDRTAPDAATPGRPLLVAIRLDLGQLRPRHLEVSAARVLGRPVPGTRAQRRSKARVEPA